MAPGFTVIAVLPWINIPTGTFMVLPGFRIAESSNKKCEREWPVSNS
jgi:hypothetical protein